MSRCSSSVGKTGSFVAVDKKSNEIAGLCLGDDWIDFFKPSLHSQGSSECGQFEQKEISENSKIRIAFDFEFQNDFNNEYAVRVI